jgi:hypothetical protein
MHLAINKLFPLMNFPTLLVAHYFHNLLPSVVDGIAKSVYELATGWTIEG